MADPIVIVGGGLAAGTAVTELRDRGYKGPITLITDEDRLPYERPPLSKGYLLGNDKLDDSLVHDQDWYADHDVEVRTDTHVESIDPADHTITVDGKKLPYAGLLLATGARPRHLPMADESGAWVHYLRSAEDSTALREQLRPGVTVGIIGGGWIGLEVASAARSHGADVILWEHGEVPLEKVVGTEVGELFAQLHREHDVDLRLGATITGITTDDGETVVTTADGRSTTVDVLVVAVGVEPAADLAKEAGLEVDNGILVDGHLQTSAPDVYAAGDVANVDHPKLGRRSRVEHWDTAIKHGKVAAAGLAGADASADDLPYFFTDQYKLGMEYLGSPGPEGFDRVVITGDTDGPVEDRSFRVYWLRGDTVVAGMQVNDWDGMDRVRELVGTDASDDDLKK